MSRKNKYTKGKRQRQKKRRFKNEKNNRKIQKI